MPDLHVSSNSHLLFALKVAAVAGNKELAEFIRRFSDGQIGKTWKMWKDVLSLFCMIAFYLVLNVGFVTVLIDYYHRRFIYSYNDSSLSHVVNHHLWLFYFK